MLRKANFIAIIFFLSATLILSMTSCKRSGDASIGGDKTAEGVPIIEYLLPGDPGKYMSEDLWSIQEWGKRTGVQFKINSPPRDAFQDKLAIIISSGDLPDMINFYQDNSTYKDYGPQLFVPLNDYLNNGQLPELKRWLDKYPDIELYMENPDDNKLYGFPFVSDFEYISRAWYVRNDLLRKAGLDADNIETLDDVKAAMLALQKAKGGGFITSSRLGYNYFAGVTGAYFGAHNGVMYDQKHPNGNKEFVYGALKPEYKKWVEFMRWMYVNKLLHSNFATMSQQELFAGYADGSFPLMIEQHGLHDKLNPEHDSNREIKYIYPPKIDGIQFRQTKSYHVNIGYRWPVVINQKSKHIDDIVRAMNFVYSDEGIEMFSLGAEGLTFERDDKTPSGYRLDYVQSVWTRKEDGTFPEGMKMLEDYGCNSWWLMGVSNESDRFGFKEYKEGENEEALFIPNIINSNIELGLVVETDPFINFNKEEKDTIAEISTPLGTYESENVLKFIYGQRPMSEWDDFINGLKKLKCEELAKIYNDKLK